MAGGVGWSTNQGEILSSPRWCEGTKTNMAPNTPNKNIKYKSELQTECKPLPRLEVALQRLPQDGLQLLHCPLALMLHLFTLI